MNALQATALLLGSLALAGGCEREAGHAGSGRGGEVVVYATVADERYLQALFASWTEDTGIRVRIRQGTAPRIVDEVIENSVNPPADLLWTEGVAGVWRAAEEGALRPIVTAGVAQHVPGWLRDPEAYWVATGYTTAVIVYGTAWRMPAAARSFADPAAAGYAGRLCLPASGLAVSRAVIAGLIADIGTRPAETVVRGWLANLARPVFATEAAMLEAIAAGDCAAGIATEADARKMSGPDGLLRTHTPEDARIVVEAIGVARHARNPQGAVALLTWLTDTAAQANYAEALQVTPATAGAAAESAATGAELRRLAADLLRPAWLAEDSGLLAERARYR